MRKCDRGEWAKFRRYHYLDTTISTSAKCYGLYDKEKIVGFIGVIHYPHPKNKKIKKVTRLVILPDYQGIGLGARFLNSVANLYLSYDFMIVTSAKNLVHALNKSKNWVLRRYNIVKDTGSGMAAMRKTHRKVKTATFKYHKNA